MSRPILPDTIWHYASKFAPTLLRPNRAIHPEDISQPRKIGICVSGGADSMLLAYLMRNSVRLLSVRPGPRHFFHVQAFIVDHGLRSESSSEAEHVQTLLRQLDIPSEILRLVWTSPKNTPKLRGLEERARIKRYRTIFAAARNHGISDLFTGHHADDQIETILSRMIRDQSLNPLSFQGMSPVSLVPCVEDEANAQINSHPTAWQTPSNNRALKSCFGDMAIKETVPHDPLSLHRPLLDYTKAQILSTCQHFGIKYVEDSTNSDPTVTIRNAIRHMRSHHFLPRALQGDRVLAFQQQSRLVLKTIEQLAWDYCKNVVRFHLHSHTGLLQISIKKLSPNVSEKSLSGFSYFVARLIELVSGQAQQNATLMNKQDTRQLYRVFSGQCTQHKDKNIDKVIFRDMPNSGKEERDVLSFMIFRAPMRAVEENINSVQLHLTRVLKKDKPRPRTRYWRWDQRFWISVQAPDVDSMKHLKLRTYRPTDVETVMRSLAKVGQVVEFEEMLAASAPGLQRFTLPVLASSIDDEVLQFPTLYPQIVLPERDYLQVTPSVMLGMNQPQFIDVEKEDCQYHSAASPYYNHFAMASQQLRAAICHVSPIFLSAAKTTQKAIQLIHRASEHSANLVVFPETYIPAFPVWSALQAPHQNHDFFFRMVQESIYANGEEMRALRSAAKQAGVLVNIGFSEKSRFSTATLYNANMLIGTDGEVLVHHRKLMPTFFEKLTWSPGDGAGLKVAHTRFGNIGTLICGENTNPLARFTMMAGVEQVHISTYPGIWPTRAASETSGGSNAPASGDYDNLAANRIRAGAHAFEGKSFGIVSAGLIDEACKEVLASGSSHPQLMKAQLDAASQATSMFVDPTGALLPGFVVDEVSGEEKPIDFLQHQPDILYADLDLSRCIEGKQYHDVTGGYQRLDVFQLKVDRTRRDPVIFTKDSA